MVEHETEDNDIQFNLVRSLHNKHSKQPIKRDQLKNLSTEGRIILKWISKKRNGGMDGIDLA
jgi:hypothetical protein